MLAFAIAYAALGAFYLVRYFSLPSDGWTVTGFPSSSDQPVVFQHNRAGRESPLLAKDVLLEVEGQPVQDILARWVRGQASRPSNWVDGGVVQYVVERNGVGTTVEVQLHRRSASLALVILRQAWPELSIGLGLAIVGLFLFLRRPRHGVARAFLVISASQVAGAGIYPWIVGYPTPSEFFDPILGPLTIFLMLVFYSLGTSALIYVFWVFPAPKGPFVKHPRLSLAVTFSSPLLLSLAVLAVSLLQPANFGVTHSALNAVFNLATLLAVTIALVHSFRTVREPGARAQLRWLATSFVSFMVANVLGLVSVALLEMNQAVRFLEAVLAIAFPIGVAVAVLRYRLFDIDVIIHRSLVYGALTAILVVLFITTSFILKQLLGAIVGTAGAVGFLGVALVVEVLFAPLRERIRRFVDRRLYPEKHEASQLLNSFAETVYDVTDMAELSERLRGVAGKVTRSTRVRLVFIEEDGPLGDGSPQADGPGNGVLERVPPEDPLVGHLRQHRGVADISRLALASVALSRLHAEGTQLVVSLVARGELFAFLTIGPRSDGNGYSVDHQLVLKALASQAGSALRLAQLAARAAL